MKSANHLTQAALALGVHQRDILIASLNHALQKRISIAKSSHKFHAMPLGALQNNPGIVITKTSKDFPVCLN